MKTFLILTVAVLCAVQNVLAQSVDPTQLAAWQSLFDSTGGLSWSSCKGKRDKPCDCSGTTAATVLCTIQNGVQFISSVRLTNNNLAGQNVPTDAINTIIGQFTPFAKFDLSGNTRLRNAAGGCLNIPNCANTTCKLDFNVCSAGSPTPPPVASTSAPTPKTTNAPTVASSAAWKSFFDTTGGLAWTKCKNTRTTPCDCQKAQPTTAPVRVVCSGTKVTRVSLVSNNLVASDFPADDITNLILAGASFIDLTGNDALAPSATCFDVPACANTGVTCNFPKPVCSPTSPPSEETLPPGVTPPPVDTTSSPSPSPEPTATDAPTATGSPVSTTGAPSTAPPTSAIPSPTVSSPTATKSPTPIVTVSTAAPTTVNSTLAPSVPSNTTAAPSIAGTTGAPSITTSTPTIPGLATTSPTSAGMVANGLVSGLAGFLLASVMLMC